MDKATSKNHIINGPAGERVGNLAYQPKYARSLAGTAALISAVCGLAAYSTHRSAGGELFVVAVVVAMSLVMALGLSAAGILLTHRVAGPIFVMTKQLSDLAHGRYPSLRALRKGDELRDFFELFQQAISLIRSREEAEVLKLESAIGTLSHLATTEELRASVKALIALRDRKHEALSATHHPSQTQPSARA